ncbi:glycosyl transferase [Histomonas meleagridis]|uniref:glycosyl transferase n=1 Tax=Histomonas meleagridis TaxID=135588 RepID=UPI0035597695|nr:glycosyl transferase [Histomonas meleagridis]KAH0796560.1 glycosyl transferase [Histomonas meleagridis]
MGIVDQIFLNLIPIIVTFISFFLIIKIDPKVLPSNTQGFGKLLKSTNSSHRRAFATLVTPAFAMGAVVLGHQLKLYHGDKYERVCLITKDVNSTWREVLKQWWDIREVNEYRPMKHFRRSWNKFHMWNFTEYEKIVYFDSDIFILQPVDELFNYSQLSCVPDVNPPQICNTGVLVIEPKNGTFEKMDKLGRVDAIRLGIGDQSSINAFFRGFTALPPIYNALRTHERGLGVRLKQNKVKVIHFVCKKPWKCGRMNTLNCGCGYMEYNKKWWDAWDEACRNKTCIESWDEKK